MSELRDRGSGAPTMIGSVGRAGQTGESGPGGMDETQLRSAELALAETALPADSQALHSTRALPNGTVLAGRYRILRKLGRGGMGEVYLAEHTSIQMRVAVKIAGVTFTNETELMRRFLQEARAASSVHHANIVDITDFGHTEENIPFFTMEYLEGEDLYETIRREGPLPWGRARAIMIQILDALAAAHEQGIIHRDMKPHNCFRITRDGNKDFIKVVDFGLAKVLSEHLDEDNMTRSGVVLGTARYMAPEQAMSLNIDHRTDIYAAGCIMFELLSGKTPFDANGFMGMLHKHIYEAPPSLRKLDLEREVSPDVDYVVHRALAKKPGDRYQTAREFADAVRSLDALSGRSQSFRSTRRKRRLSLAAGALVTVLGGGALVSAFAGERGEDRPHPDSPRVAAAGDPSQDHSPDATAAAEAKVERETAAATSETPAADTKQPAAPEGAPGEDEGDPPTKPADDEVEGSAPAVDERATKPAAKQIKKKAAKKVAKKVSKKAGKKAAKAETPEQLSDAQVRATINKSSKREVQTCGQKHGAFVGERVRVSFTIHASGATSDVKVHKIGAQPLGHCIAGVLKKAKFSKAKRGRAVNHSFTL